MKIADFFAEIGLQGDGSVSVKVKDLIEGFGNLEAATLGEIGALVELGYKFVEIAKQAFDTAAGFQMFSSQTGLSWRELQKWQIVAEQANVSADAVKQSVSALQRQMAEIRMGRGNIAPFQLLGVDPRNASAFQVLDQIRDRIKGLDRATATNLLQQMGLNPEMIQLLSLSNAEFSRLAHTSEGMTRSQERIFLQGKQALVQFHQALTDVGYKVVELFGPIWTNLLHLSTDLIKGLTAGVEFLGKAFSDSWADIKIAVVGIGGAIAIYFAPITAMIVGLILVLDDLATYFRGGKSVTGLAIEGFKKLAEELENSKIFKMLDKIGGLAGLAAGLPGLPAMAGAAAARGTVSMVNNLTQTIHASDPHEVAKQTVNEHKKQIAHATDLMNNQGY